MTDWIDSSGTVRDEESEGWLPPRPCQMQSEAVVLHGGILHRIIRASRPIGSVVLKWTEHGKSTGHGQAEWSLDKVYCNRGYAIVYGGIDNHTDADHLEAQLSALYGGTADLQSPNASIEVAEFCGQHNLGLYLATAMSLVRGFFNIVGSLTCRVQRDPEVGDAWIVIDARVWGTRHSVRQQYHNYLRELSVQIPSAAAEKIRLFYGRV